MRNSKGPLENLESLGLSKSQLKKRLADSDDPLREIAEIQRENAISIPFLQAILPFADQTGVSRSTFYGSLLDSLKQTFLDRLDMLKRDSNVVANKTINEMAETLLPFIMHDSLAGVAKKVLKCASEISSERISYIRDNVEVYKAVPIEVKRMVWVANEAMFEKELVINLKLFIESMEDCLKRNDSDIFKFPPPRFADINGIVPPDLDRPHCRLRNVLNLIGSYRSLCDLAVRHSYSMFVSTKNGFYCTVSRCLLEQWKLNNQIVRDPNSKRLIAGSASEIQVNDPARTTGRSYVMSASEKCAEILSACISREACGGWMLRALGVIFTSFKERLEHPQFADLICILGDPFVTNLFGSVILRTMHRSLDDDENLSMGCTGNAYNLTLLLINSLSAWQIVNKRESPTFDVPSQISEDMYPSLMYLLSCSRDDNFSDSANSSNSSSTSTCFFDDQLFEFLETNKICHFLLQAIVVELIYMRQTFAFSKIIQELRANMAATSLNRTDEILPAKVPYTFLVDQLWLHQVGCALLHSCLRLANAEKHLGKALSLVDSVMLGFVSAAAQTDANEALSFSYRTLHSLGSHIPALNTIFLKMLEKVRPPEHAELLWTEYTALKRKLEQENEVSENISQDTLLSLTTRNNWNSTR